MTVGIVGYGRFGSLAAKYISRKADVVVYDPALRSHRSLAPHIRSGTVEDVASNPVVVMCVPVSALRATLRVFAPHLRPSTLVIDVCAVKVMPCKWMKKILPKSVEILGTHPLFGPDSASDSVQGHVVCVCPVRIGEKRLRHAIRLLRNAGLATSVLSPVEHDRMASETLFLTQYVGRLVGMTKPRAHAVSTKSYRDLMKMVKIADNDTEELFRDMVLHNPYAQRMLARLFRAGKGVQDELS